MADNNAVPETTDNTAEVGKRRRSSILKVPKPNTADADNNTNVDVTERRASKRVSFSNLPQIKLFPADTAEAGSSVVDSGGEHEPAVGVNWSGATSTVATDCCPEGTADPFAILQRQDNAVHFLMTLPPVDPNKKSDGAFDDSPLGTSVRTEVASRYFSLGEEMEMTSIDAASVTAQLRPADQSTLGDATNVASVTEDVSAAERSLRQPSNLMDMTCTTATSLRVPATSSARHGVMDTTCAARTALRELPSASSASAVQMEMTNVTETRVLGASAVHSAAMGPMDMSCVTITGALLPGDGQDSVPADSDVMDMTRRSMAPGSFWAQSVAPDPTDHCPPSIFRETCTVRCEEPKQQNNAPRRGSGFATDELEGAGGLQDGLRDNLGGGQVSRSTREAEAALGLQGCMHAVFGASPAKDVWESLRSGVKALTLEASQTDASQPSFPSESDSLPPHEKTGFYRSKSKGPAASDDSLELDTSDMEQSAPDTTALVRKSMFMQNVPFQSTMIGEEYREATMPVQDVSKCTVEHLVKKAEEGSLSRAFRQLVGTDFEAQTAGDMDLELTLLGMTGKSMIGKSARAASTHTVLMEDSNALRQHSLKVGGASEMSIEKSHAGPLDPVVTEPKDWKLLCESSGRQMRASSIAFVDGSDAMPEDVGSPAAVSSLSSFRHLDHIFSPTKPASHGEDASVVLGPSGSKKQTRSVLGMSAVVNLEGQRGKVACPVERSCESITVSGRELIARGIAQPSDVTSEVVDEKLVRQDKLAGGSRSASKSLKVAKDVEMGESVRHVSEATRGQECLVTHSRGVLRPLENFETQSVETTIAVIDDTIEKRNRSVTNEAGASEKIVGMAVQSAEKRETVPQHTGNLSEEQFEPTADAGRRHADVAVTCAEERLPTGAAASQTPTTASATSDPSALCRRKTFVVSKENVVSLCGTDVVRQRPSETFTLARENNVASAIDSRSARSSHLKDPDAQINSTVNDAATARRTVAAFDEPKDVACGQATPLERSQKRLEFALPASPFVEEMLLDVAEPSLVAVSFGSMNAEEELPRPVTQPAFSKDFGSIGDCPDISGVSVMTQEKSAVKETPSTSSTLTLRPCTRSRVLALEPSSGAKASSTDTPIQEARTTRSSKKTAGSSQGILKVKRALPSSNSVAATSQRSLRLSRGQQTGLSPYSKLPKLSTPRKTRLATDCGSTPAGLPSVSRCENKSTVYSSASSTKHVGSTTKHVGSTTKHVGSTTKRVGSTTKRVGSTTKHVGSTTKRVGSTTKSAPLSTEHGQSSSKSASKLMPSAAKPASSLVKRMASTTKSVSVSSRKVVQPAAASAVSSAVPKSDIAGVFSVNSFAAFASFFEVSQLPSFDSFAGAKSTVSSPPSASQPAGLQPDRSAAAAEVPEVPMEVVEPSDREEVSAELDLEVDLDVDGIMDRVDDLDLRHTLYWSVSDDQHEHEVAAFDSTRIVFKALRGKILVYVELAERVRRSGARDLFTNADGVKARRNTKRIHNIWFHSEQPADTDYAPVYVFLDSEFRRKVDEGNLLRRYPCTDDLGKLLKEISAKSHELTAFVDDVVTATSRYFFRLKDSILSIRILCHRRLLYFYVNFKIDLDTYPDEVMVPSVRNNPTYTNHMPPDKAQRVMARVQPGVNYISRMVKELRDFMAK